MRYIVINHFTDLQDNNRKYKEGDIYPRDGYEPSAERIDELSSDKNKLRKSLIIPEAEDDVISDSEFVDTAEAVSEEETEDAEEVEAEEEKPKKRSGRKKS